MRTRAILDDFGPRPIDEDASAQWMITPPGPTVTSLRQLRDSAKQAPQSKRSLFSCAVGPEGMVCRATGLCDESSPKSCNGDAAARELGRNDRGATTNNIQGTNSEHGAEEPSVQLLRTPGVRPCPRPAIKTWRCLALPRRSLTAAGTARPHHPAHGPRQPPPPPRRPPHPRTCSPCSPAGTAPGPCL